MYGRVRERKRGEIRTHFKLYDHANYVLDTSKREIGRSLRTHRPFASHQGFWTNSKSTNTSHTREKSQEL